MNFQKFSGLKNNLPFILLYENELTFSVEKIESNDSKRKYDFLFYGEKILDGSCSRSLKQERREIL